MRAVNRTLPSVFRKKDRRYFLREGYEFLLYANSVHKRKKSGEDDQGVEWMRKLLQAEKRKEAGCKWAVERRYGVVRQHCTMAGTYCERV